METNAIVVGVDGTASSHAAVRWAAREAARRNAVLRVMHAFDWNWQGAHYDAGADFLDVAREAASALTAVAVDQATAVAPTVRTEQVSAIGNPVPRLLEAAQSSALVVLGNRGRGGFASLLLGSVSQRVATHAPCSVVIVRGRTDVVDGPIVVGVDDSPGSEDVLATAFDLAAGRGCALVAVRTYLPPMPLWVADVPPVLVSAPESDAAEHRRLDEQLARWRDKYPQVAVESLISHGGAAAVLVGVSRTAQLVVVGSRGHGPIADALLGSTGMQLLHHAECPVLIARKPIAREPIAG